ncbi:hypothetical protein [Hoeflea poritis]|uniref:Uncharacterized protein n=1 Tax=Hoeflea poritis TaxID=2993659 RepID=A0ABT4VIL1_9HYPH|nr:hypothetical protein [Hoeflea poritis]MDA4843967.1 hypothetical protein [Hoeflea poritis]
MPDAEPLANPAAIKEAFYENASAQDGIERLVEISDQVHTGILAGEPMVPLPGELDLTPAIVAMAIWRLGCA